MRRPVITICVVGAGIELPPGPGWEQPVAAWWRLSTSRRAAPG